MKRTFGILLAIYGIIVLLMLTVGKADHPDRASMRERMATVKMF